MRDLKIGEGQGLSSKERISIEFRLFDENGFNFLAILCMSLCVFIFYGHYNFFVTRDAETVPKLTHHQHGWHFYNKKAHKEKLKALYSISSLGFDGQNVEYDEHGGVVADS